MNKTSTIKKYITEVCQQDIIAIILTGSAGRGDFDKFSDIDNVVIVSDNYHLNKIKEGKFDYYGYLFDTRIISLSNFKKNWSEDEYFAYLNGKLVFDRKDCANKIILSKRQKWDSELPKKISMKLVELSVIFDFKDNWRGLKTITHFDKFIQRHDYISAARLLNFGQEDILDIIYLVNDVPVPDYKNKIKLLTSLKWLPKNFKYELEIKSDLETLSLVYLRLDNLLRIVAKKVESRLNLPIDIYYYYLKERA